MTIDIGSYASMFVSEEASQLLEKKDKKGKEIPLFVYGTLRVGERLHTHYSSGISKSHCGVTTSGCLYFPGHYSFPGARFDHEGTMTGDLLWYPTTNLAFHDVVTMELGAGYELVAIEAVLPSGKGVKALAFQHRHTDEMSWPVPGNDWCCADARDIIRKRAY